MEKIVTAGRKLFLSIKRPMKQAVVNYSFSDSNIPNMQSLINNHNLATEIRIITLGVMHRSSRGPMRRTWKKFHGWRKLFVSIKCPMQHAEFFIQRLQYPEYALINNHNLATERRIITLVVMHRSSRGPMRRTWKKFHGWAEIIFQNQASHETSTCELFIQ